MKLNNKKILYGKNTSIIVNTFNRKNLLLRTCNILEELNFGGQLIICDASEGLAQKEIKKNIDNSLFTYSLKYLNIPKGRSNFYESVNKCFLAGLKVVNKSFTVFTNEDDIPIPETLTEFENFLIKKKDFNACMGRLIWHNYSIKERKKKLILMGVLDNLKNFIFGERVGEANSGYDLIDKDWSSRLNKFIKKPVNYYFAFQRSNGMSEIIAKNFHEFDRNHGHFSTEYYYWFVTILRGKLKYFYKPYILRTYHGDNLSHPDNNSYAHEPIFEKLKNINWNKNLSLFETNLNTIQKQFDSQLNENKILKNTEKYIIFYIFHRLRPQIIKLNRDKKILKYIFKKIIKVKIEIIFLKLRFYLKLSKAIHKAEN